LSGTPEISGEPEFHQLYQNSENGLLTMQK